MLQTSNVNAGCDKLATELSWQCFVSKVANFQLPAIIEGYIAYFSMRMREPGLVLLPVWNLTSSSCTWTLISCKKREFQRFGHKLSLYCTFFNVHEQNCLISTSGLKSDVTLAFLDPISTRRGNLGGLRTFKAEISISMFAWLFGTFWPKWWFSGAKWRSEWVSSFLTTHQHIIGHSVP